MLDRTPVAVWWLLGLLLLGVGVVPLVGAEARADLAGQEALEAEGWVGTTVVVEGDFERLDAVRDVRPGIQAADALYVADLPDGTTVEVRKPARRDDGVLRLDLQPETLLLRVPAGDAETSARGTILRAVEWGPRVQPAETNARQRERAARAADDRAATVRVVTGAAALVVGLGCASATWAARRARRRPGWFAGTRAPVGEDDPDVLERAATSGELPVATALLVGLVAVAPPSTHPARLVLVGLVALGACALLARERDALERADGVAVDDRRRRRAVAARALHGLALVAGVVLAVVPSSLDDHRARGVAAAALAASVLVSARWQARARRRGRRSPPPVQQPGRPPRARPGPPSDTARG